MNLLPWLLNWPPRPASVVAFLLVTGFSVGTLVLFGGVTDEISGGEVTVESADLSVRLNDEVSYPETGEDGVLTCMASGTPGDHLLVRGEVSLDVPVRADRDGLTLAVRLEETGDTTTERTEQTGRTTVDVFWLLEDDETLSVGETATFRLDVRRDGSSVANATRTVTVEEGSRRYDC